MKRCPKPIRTFRVYPEGKSLYWDVWLFRTVSEMRKTIQTYCRIVNGESSDGSRISFDKKTLAQVSSRKVISYRNGRARARHCLGQIFFAFGTVGSEIVSHEAAHATLYYFTRMGLVHDDSTDERFARILGQTVRAITKEIW